MLIAAVDLGSNSFRCELANIQRGTIERVLYTKETVRLAAGLQADGTFTDAVKAKAFRALDRFRSHLAGVHPDWVLAVGTQAFRTAKDADLFLAECAKHLGHPIRLISGEEEAHYVYQGCAYSLHKDESRLVVDIGGASTELILGQGYKPLDVMSFPFGCVNSSLRFFENQVMTPSQFQDGIEALKAELAPYASRFSSDKFTQAYGSAGTFGAILEVAKALRWSSSTITRHELQQLQDVLIGMKTMQAIHLPGLKPDRKEVLAGGLCALIAVFEALKLETMSPAMGALRYGLLYELMQRYYTL